MCQKEPSLSMLSGIGEAGEGISEGLADRGVQSGESQQLDVDHEHGDQVLAKRQKLKHAPLFQRCGVHGRVKEQGQYVEQLAVSEVVHAEA